MTSSSREARRRERGLSIYECSAGSEASDVRGGSDRGVKRRVVALLRSKPCCVCTSPSCQTAARARRPCSPPQGLRMAGRASHVGRGGGAGQRRGGKSDDVMGSASPLVFCARASPPAALALADLASSATLPPPSLDRVDPLGAGHVTSQVQPRGFHFEPSFEKRGVPSLLNAIFGDLRFAPPDYPGCVVLANTRCFVARQPNPSTA